VNARRRVLAVARVAAGATLLLDGVRRLDQGSAAIADVDRWGVPAPQVLAPALAAAETFVGSALVAGALVALLGRGGRWTRIAGVVVLGLVPAALASTAGFGGLIAARCNDDVCPAIVPDPDREFGVRPAPRGAGRDGAGPRPQIVVADLDFPTAIAFTPDGRMVVNERSGRILIVEDGHLRPEPLAVVPTTTHGERGLLGAAVGPDGDAVYVFVTQPDGRSNRVVRIALDDGSQRTVVGGLAGGIYHDGGGVAFDADGNLLVSNGEQHSGNRAQRLGVPGGKLYRYTAAGAPAPGNPFGRSAVFALGLRNPFGLAVDPVSGRPFVTENGPDGHDEINRVDRGANLGWPEIRGISRGDRLDDDAPGPYRDPLLEYRKTVVPTGIAFSPDGDLYFGTYGEGAIHRVHLDRARTRVVSDTVFVDVGAPVVAVAWGPDGLYFSTPADVRFVLLDETPVTRQ
jgi:glucose/arabinose dehydrogenase